MKLGGNALDWWKTSMGPSSVRRVIRCSFVYTHSFFCTESLASQAFTDSGIHASIQVEAPGDD